MTSQEMKIQLLMYTFWILMALPEIILFLLEA